jgi:hypothetical protein
MKQCPDCGGKLHARHVKCPVCGGKLPEKGEKCTETYVASTRHELRYVKCHICGELFTDFRDSLSATTVQGIQER